MRNGQVRKNVHIGSLVEIIQKHHQRSGKLTEGFVAKLLTKSLEHPHGIKGMLKDGIVGRVKNIIEIDA